MSIETSIPQITLTAQGRELKIHVPGAKPLKIYKKRSEITNFSRSSRNRLLSLMNRLLWEDKTRKIFVSLTYSNNFDAYPGLGFPDVHTAKQHLRAFLKRLRRLFPQAHLCELWRLEPQLENWRWAPHFHIILWGLPYYPQKRLQAIWQDITGSPRPYCWIEKIRSFQELKAYVSKYVGKEMLIPAEVRQSAASANPEGAAAAPGAATSFNLSAYWAAGWNKLGRLWGIEDRQHLPLAPITEQQLPAGAWYADLLRSIRAFRRGQTEREIERVNEAMCRKRKRWVCEWHEPSFRRSMRCLRLDRGAKLFTDNPESWLKLGDYYARVRGEQEEEREYQAAIVEKRDALGPDIARIRGIRTESILDIGGNWELNRCYREMMREWYPTWTDLERDIWIGKHNRGEV